MKLTVKIDPTAATPGDENLFAAAALVEAGHDVRLHLPSLEFLANLADRLPQIHSRIEMVEEHGAAQRHQSPGQLTADDD